MQINKGVCIWYVSPGHLRQVISQINKIEGCELISVVPYKYHLPKIRISGNFSDGQFVETVGELTVKEYLIIYENLRHINSYEVS